MNQPKHETETLRQALRGLAEDAKKLRVQMGEQAYRDFFTFEKAMTTEEIAKKLLREVKRMTPAEKLKVRRILSKAFNSCRLGAGGKYVN